MPYFKHALENKNFKYSLCAGQGYFKDGSAENSDLFRCGKAVAFLNKKYNNNNNKMEILAIPIMNPLAGVHDSLMYKSLCVEGSTGNFVLK